MAGQRTRNRKRRGEKTRDEACNEQRIAFAHWTELPQLDSKTIAATTDPGNPVERLAAAILLVLVSPLLLMVAIAIKLDSPGPVFFRQERVGVDRRKNSNGESGRALGNRRERRKTAADGQLFRMWKFRSMVTNAEAKTGPVWAKSNDPRITRVGHILRLTRLDEIPQLINVVNGQMRLIGPRPERPEFVTKLATDLPRYSKRLAVPPGITGLAQVEREYDASLDHVRKKLCYDIFYIENRSWLMDLKILAKTVDVVLRRTGAR